MSIVINIIVSAATVFASLWGIYNYAPVSVFELTSSVMKLGADITTIQGTDTLKDSRATINTNFANLNAYKIENSTTSVAAITTLANLASVGTIITGVWNGTVIGVAHNGTGTTSPTSNLLLLGNGASGIKVVNGTGASGEFLQSQGAGTAPIWATSSIDQAANYTWTASTTFSGTPVTFTGATTTVGHLSVDGSKLTLNGQTYFFGAKPSTAASGGNQTASSTVLSYDGKGAISFSPPDMQQVGETISSSTSNTISVHNLPARKMYIIDLFVAGASTVYDPSVRFNGDIAGNYSSRRSLNFGADAATTSATFIDLSVGSGFANTGQMTAQIVNTATNPKIITGTAIGPGANAGAETQRIEFSGSWHNTSVSISTITIYSSLSSSLFSANTRLTIYASKD